MSLPKEKSSIIYKTVGFFKVYLEVRSQRNMLKWNLENYYSLLEEESRSCFYPHRAVVQGRSCHTYGGEKHNNFPNFIKPGGGQHEVLEALGVSNKQKNCTSSHQFFSMGPHWALIRKISSRTREQTDSLCPKHKTQKLRNTEGRAGDWEKSTTIPAPSWSHQRRYRNAKGLLPPHCKYTEIVDR